MLRGLPAATPTRECRRNELHGDQGEHRAGGEGKRERQQRLDVLDQEERDDRAQWLRGVVSTAAQNWRDRLKPAACIGIATLVPSGMFCRPIARITNRLSPARSEA